MNGCGRRRYFAAAGVFLCCILLIGQQGRQAFRQNLRTAIFSKTKEQALTTYLPLVSYMEKGKGRGGTSALAGFFGERIPLYAWMQDKAGDKNGWEPTYNSLAASLPSQEETLSGEDMIEAVKRENEGMDFQDIERLEELEEIGKESLPDFSEAEKSQSLDREALADFSTLVSRFYAVDSTTYIGRDQLNIDKLLDKDMRLQQTDADSPQILIYHTHSQEGFMDSVPGDDNTTIMGVGEYLAEILRRQYGYNVLHHLGKYDVESRDYAYSNAAPALEQVLQENPSIEVIIDLHRDEMPGDKKLVTELSGRQTAKVMFFNGLSRTNKTGEIASLQNPNQEENLAFSFQMQATASEYYPGFTRKIYLKGYRYNMQYRGKTLLIELGAQTNTLEEAMNACPPLAHILSLVLSGEEPDKAS